MAISTPQTETRTVWAIDPAHTEVGFSAKHMMITTVRGKFTEVTGTIVADESNHANSSVDVEINAASIDTRNEQRDGHLRSADFLDTEHYPTISFKSTGIDVLSADELKVTGDLTIRGVTRPVTLEATINGQGKTPFGTEVAGISLKGEINRKDFGLNWNVALETGGVLVSDKVKIDIEVEAVKQIQ
jgi:polyisoprenoid-binding protein YceI